MDAILAQKLAEHAFLRTELVTQFRDIDEVTLADTLEGLSSLPETISAVIRSYLDDLSLAAALGQRIVDMQERLGRFEARAEKKRALVTLVMERADLRKLQEPDFTVSLRVVPPGLVVSDETAIPDEFWKPQPAKLDRKGLLATLNAGQTVPGATLANGSTTISVRTR